MFQNGEPFGGANAPEDVDGWRFVTREIGKDSAMDTGASDGASASASAPGSATAFASASASSSASAAASTSASTSGSVETAPGGPKKLSESEGARLALWVDEERLKERGLGKSKYGDFCYGFFLPYGVGRMPGGGPGIEMPPNALRFPRF